MSLFLAFAPFVVFALIERQAGLLPALAAAAALSAVLLLRDRLRRRGPPKLLEAGSLLLFGGLALYGLLAAPAWSLAEVRLWIDGGLLALVLLSLALRRPFTLRYAREWVAPALWESRAFLRANLVITAVWALAFAAMLLGDLVLLARPDLPQRSGALVTLLALAGAVGFTVWYPRHLRSKAAGR